jgi:hypothetical protein
VAICHGIKERCIDDELSVELGLQFKKNALETCTLFLNDKSSCEGLLLYGRSSLFGLGGRRNRDIDDLAAIVRTALHADSMTLVQSTAGLTFRNTRCIESVM